MKIKRFLSMLLIAFGFLGYTAALTTAAGCENDDDFEMEVEDDEIEIDD